MHVSCTTCGREFEVDDALAANLNAARCVCAARLSLNDGGANGGLPRRLGKYMLERRIATGGMGEIYRGKIAGVEGFEREVAIKKMLPHLSADRDFINMMVKEAKLTVLLNHPNVVQVYDLSKEGNEYYIAMEFVSGINLGMFLERCRGAKVRPPAPACVYIAVQMLRGLAYAHELRDSEGQPMNVLHRDITPQNILVTRAGFVKITDFGIAKARNEISTTSPGMIKGKLGYIAPEQLTGGDVDQRVDIFCAGIVLWESLAVRRLFKGQSEIDSFRLIAEARVPSLHDIRPDVPESLEAVIRKALAKDPDDRYAGATVFADALTQAMAPLGIDELGNATREFFANHPDLFAIEPDDDELNSDQPTVELSSSDSSTLTDITSLLIGAARPTPAAAASSPAPRASRAGFGALVALVFLLLGGGAVWLLGRRGPGPEPAPAAGTAALGVAPPAGASSPNPPAVSPAEPQKARPAPPRANPKDSEPLTPPEIQAVVSGSSAHIVRCLQKVDRATAPPQIDARISIDTSGRISDVELKPSLSPTDAQQCLLRALRGLRFRKQPVKDFRVTIPLKIQVM